MYISKLENKIKKEIKVEKTGIPKTLSSQGIVENIHISRNSINLHNFAISCIYSFIMYLFLEFSMLTVSMMNPYKLILLCK